MSARGRSARIAAFFRPRSAGPAAERAGLLIRRERFAAAQTLVSAFYAVLFFFSFGDLFAWPEILGRTGLEPRWPVFWLRWVDTGGGIAFILWLHLAGGLLAVALCRFRAARIAVFVTLLEFLALRYSVGPVNHGDHLGLLLSFVLIFLPAGWHAYPTASRPVRAATLLVVSGCQAMIALTYSMSGLWKALGVVEQVLRGEVHYLAPQGLAQQVAAKLLSGGGVGPLGPWLIDHAWVGWPLMIAALYLELFALWAVPRPSLHQAWGLGLILLHVSTFLTMGVGFAQNVLWLALFFVLSPLRPATLSWRQMLRDLPRPRQRPR